MNTFVKNMIKGVLSVSTLFIVGKVCYEVGKNVGDLERQLEELKSAENLNKAADVDNMELAQQGDDLVAHHIEKMDAEEMSKPVEEIPASGIVTKVRNAKMFLGLKKVFDKRDRPKGILGSLLTNPDGAKIEAIVKDGGVQISVKPRAA